MDTPLVPAGMSSWTDAGYLYMKHRLPCVVFGAGQLAPAHSNHEWIEVADLVRLVGGPAARPQDRRNSSVTPE